MKKKTSIYASWVKCVAACSVGSGQALHEGLKGPRMPAKQTKQPSVSGAESKSVRGCRGFSVSQVQFGSLCEIRRGQKEKVNSQQSQNLDEKLPCARICHAQGGGLFCQIISLICYQQQQSLRSISNVLFWNPHYDNESDFDEEWNQSGRLTVEWMAELNPSIIRKLEWVGTRPDKSRSLFLTDVYSWPCEAFMISSMVPVPLNCLDWLWQWWFGLPESSTLWQGDVSSPADEASVCVEWKTASTVLNPFLGLHINGTHLSGGLFFKLINFFICYCWESVVLITAPPLKIKKMQCWLSAG